MPYPEFPKIRQRRMRSHPWARALNQEHQLNATDLIWPCFVTEGKQSEDIHVLPGQKRLCINDLIKKATEAAHLNIPAIALFPQIAKSLKDNQGSYALNKDNIIVKAVKALKKEKLPIGIIADIALDPYTNHGHDGVLNTDGDVDNDKTIKILTDQAELLADSGVDILAPSDMQDGKIKSIRAMLEQKHHQHVKILAYTAKYASTFYGPFRSAIGAGNEKTNRIKKDKKSYQMDPANSKEALTASHIHTMEGADMLMVKPAMNYLDVVYLLSQNTTQPVFAYQVSGEYQMMYHLAKTNEIDLNDVFYESLLACKRSGAGAILTYHALEMAKELPWQKF